MCPRVRGREQIGFLGGNTEIVWLPTSTRTAGSNSLPSLLDLSAWEFRPSTSGDGGAGLVLAGG